MWGTELLNMYSKNVFSYLNHFLKDRASNFDYFLKLFNNSRRRDFSFINCAFFLTSGTSLRYHQNSFYFINYKYFAYFLPSCILLKLNKTRPILLIVPSVHTVQTFGDDLNWAKNNFFWVVHQPCAPYVLLITEEH